MYYMFFIYLFMNYLLIEIHKLRIQVLLKNVATKYLLQSSSILLFVHFVFVYVICVFLYTIVFWIMRIKIYI